MTTPRTDEAYHRYHTGKGYCETIKIAITSPGYPTREMLAFLPLHLLYGFSLELLLKAWLLHSGCISEKVRKYGHDIKSLYEEAQKENLPVITGLSDMVTKYAGPHGNYTYRYLNDGDEFPNTVWADDLRILDKLEIATDTFVGASAHHGLKPGH